MPPVVQAIEKKESNLIDVLIFIVSTLLVVCFTLTVIEFYKMTQPLQPRIFNECYAATPNEDTSIGDGRSKFYYYHQLSEQERVLYDKMYHSYLRMEESFEIPTNDIDIIKKVRRFVMFDHPEIFWCDMKGTVETREDGYYYYPIYTVTKRERKKIEKTLNTVYINVSQKLTGDETPYEKIRCAYDYVIENTEYNADLSDDQSIRGAVMNHEGVCTGYAKLYQLLLSRLGIKNAIVYGKVDTEKGEQYHLWNAINIGDDLYYSDATFGDGSSNNYLINHEFLLFKNEGDKKREIIYPFTSPKL